jgi:hypothetical protein
MNQKPLYFALILTTLLLALHLYALHTFFYWYHRWFDIPMHVLGGMAIGAFLLAFFNVRRTALYFSCMLVVVIGWELFEYFGHISTGQPGYWTDTVKDMADGMIGAAITYFLTRRPLWRSN